MKGPSPTAVGSSQPATPPISDAQLREMALADERVKRFAFALKLASWNGGGLMLFAIVALISGFFDPSSFLIGLVLGALAFTELRGRRLLASYDRRGLVILTWNQVALVGLVCIYALLQMRAGMSEPSPLAGMLQQSGDLSGMLDGDAPSAAPSAAGGSAEISEMDGVYQSAIVIFYTLVIAVTAVFQGGCALYYWTRRKHLDEFLEHTPAWAIEWKRNQRAP